MLLPTAQVPSTLNCNKLLSKLNSSPVSVIPPVTLKFVLSLISTLFCVAKPPRPKFVRAVETSDKSDKLFDVCKNVVVFCVDALPSPRFVLATLTSESPDKFPDLLK